MQLTNNHSRYGAISRLLHWLMAALLIGQVALGQYMVDLDYYDAWYHQAPSIHRSVGLLIALLLLLRFVWRVTNTAPDPIGRPWEIVISHWLHRLFYLLILLLAVSGYLLSTADGHAIVVFDWLKIPATLSGIDQQEDIAGEIHEWLVWLLVFLVSIHALAALKHHFIDKDAVLNRMLGRTEPPNQK